VSTGATLPGVRNVSGHSDHFRRAVAVARASLGVVTLAQLVAQGIPETTVRSWARAGRLIRLYRGVYAVGHDALRRDGLWLAGLLACGDGAALSHATAAAVHDLRPWFGRLIDVSVPQTRHQHRGIRLHRPRRLEASDVTRVGHLVVTTPTRTVLDLWRTHPRSVVENVAADAERRGLLDFARIDEDAPLALRRMLGRGPKLVRAKLERRFLTALRAAGLPEPEANVWLTHGGGEEWQADFVFWRQRVIVELDDDSHRTAKAFELDRVKDIARQADGYATPRFTLRRVDEDLDAVLRTLATLLAQRNRS
jgi:hypothetical protein